MKLFQSIRFRIVVACIFFSIVVTICYGWLTFYGASVNSDELFNWYISQEADVLIEEYNRNPNQDLSLMTTAKVLISDEKTVLKQLALYFKGKEGQAQFYKATTLEQIDLPGPIFITEQGHTIYEFSDDKITVHILKSKLPKSLEQHFYYIVDVSKFLNYENNSRKYIASVFLKVLIVIMLLGLIIGFILAKMVVSPLTRLAKSVDSIDYSQLQKSKETYFNDEIGFLANRIDSFVVRTNEFIQREKAFSRDVSHELRTPLASSQAALELAMSTSEGQQGVMNKFLQRMFRANKDMTHLIETFLLLGREESSNLSIVEFNLHDLVNRSFTKHAYLKRSSHIQCINKIEPDCIMREAEQYLAIVIDNLVRNALQHTNDGYVLVYADGNKIFVEDTGDGVIEQEMPVKHINVLKKSGVGLSIVKRLSESQNWQVEMLSKHGEGTCVSINISTPLE